MVDRLTQRFPRLTAVLLYALVSVLVFLPLFAGRVLLPEMSDQRTGYPFRQFAAEYFREHGGIPEWSPYLFGGIPFLANTGHGDTFYPTFLLRLLLGVDTGMAAAFMIHVVLAGFFTFLFLRAVRLDWGPAFAGGAAYMLSGQIISLTSPGHDGKMYVSAILPLALLFLYKAVTRGDWRQYVYFGVAVGFALLSPHFQLTYYLLMAAGFFWLYLAFFSMERPDRHAWWTSGLLFAGALGVGFAIAAVQLIPFVEYIPFSPRGAGGSSTGYEYGTSWSLPPEEVLSAIWPTFSGILELYWGRNPFKLHSEYVGIGALLLATLAFRLEGRRRLVWFFGFLGVYGLVFAFGGYTPFYHIPYTVLPGIAKTRAPSMIFFLVSFSVAALAGLGAQWLLERRARANGPERVRAAGGTGAEAAARGAIPRSWLVWLGVLAVAALLAFGGIFRDIMLGFAPPERADVVFRNYPEFVEATVRAILVALAVVAVHVLTRRARWSPASQALALSGVVLLDLWMVGQRYVRWSPPAEVIFAADETVTALQRDTSIYRVLPVGVYGENYLMVHDIRSALGYHGNELQRYDELLGGKNVWANLGNPNLWEVLGIRYIAAAQPLQQIPGIVPVVDRPLRTFEGGAAYLYRVENAAPYAYLVPTAVKAPEEAVLPTLLDPRFDPRRALLVPADAPAGEESIAALPEPIAAPVSIREVRAGLLEARLSAPAPEGSYLFVAENWYPDWEATVDGEPAPVVRAQHALIGVPLRAGARTVTLVYEDDSYDLGLAVSLAAAAATLIIIGFGWWSARRQRENG